MTIDFVTDFDSTIFLASPWNSGIVHLSPQESETWLIF